MTAMAVDVQSLKFAFVDKDEIFFEVLDTGDGQLETDCLSPTNECHLKIIKNRAHQYLVVDGEYLRFEARTMRHIKKGDCQFNIYTYQNCGRFPGEIPAILQVYHNEEKRIICMGDSGKQVYAARQPENIPLTKDLPESWAKYVFILREVKEKRDVYRIKPHQCELFLCCEVEGSIAKLVLKEAAEELQLLSLPSKLSRGCVE